MSRYFMQNTKYAAFERMMMSIPRYQPAEKKTGSRDGFVSRKQKQSKANSKKK